MEGLNALVSADLRDAWWKLLHLMSLSVPQKGSGSSSGNSGGSSKEQKQQEAGLAGSGVEAEPQQQQQRLRLEASALDVLGMLHVAYDNLRVTEEDEKVRVWGGSCLGRHVA